MGLLRIYAVYSIFEMFYVLVTRTSSQAFHLQLTCQGHHHHSQGHQGVLHGMSRLSAALHRHRDRP